MSLEIHKILTLSTGHLTEKACNDYLNDVIAYPKAEHGWFLYVPDTDLEDAPASLRDCMDFAEKQGCAWLMFDCDGPTVEELLYYEW